MNTRNNSKFAGIVLGIYADMIGIKYEKAFLHLIRNKDIINPVHRTPLAKVLRNTQKFENVEPQWHDISGSSDLWNKLQDHLNSKPYKFSDDTVLSLATIAALEENVVNPNFKKFYFEFGNTYRQAGFGGGFKNWVDEPEPGPGYGANTNGAIMRISPIGYTDLSLSDKIRLANLSACVTHNSHEAIQSTNGVTRIIDALKNDRSLSAGSLAYSLLYDGHKDLIENLPQLSFTKFDYQCESTYWNVLSILWHSTSADNLIFNMIKTGGDTDTIGMIAGSIYAVNNPVPENMIRYVKDNLHPDLLKYVFN